MSITDQEDNRELDAQSCACGSLGLSNYANAEVKALAEHSRPNQAREPITARHASAINNMRRLWELEAAPVVDLTTYRTILRYFGFHR